MATPWWEQAPTTGDRMETPQYETTDAPAVTLGMSFAALGEEQRKAFGIAESVEGVVITAVEDGTPAAEKGLKPCDVIVEVAQYFVDDPATIAERVAALKAEGRHNAHRMIADTRGALRVLEVPRD